MESSALFRVWPPSVSVCRSASVCPGRPRVPVRTRAPRSGAASPIHRVASAAGAGEVIGRVARTVGPTATAENVCWGKVGGGRSGV